LLAVTLVVVGAGIVSVLRWTAGSGLAGVAALNEDTIWRVQSVLDIDGIETGPAGSDWRNPGYDDREWAPARGEVFGDYGYWQTSQLMSLRLRAAFGAGPVPGDVRLVFRAAYRGGIVVYLNGIEVARSHLPPGDLSGDIVATAYPVEAYLGKDGRMLARSARPAHSDSDLYEARIRHVETVLPAELLREGENVVALELCRAAEQDLPERAWYEDENGDMSWNLVGFCGAELVVQGGAGIEPNTGPRDGVSAWNAETTAAVAMGAIDHGGYPERLEKMSLVAPRNGVCSGQVVLSSGKEPVEVRAKLGPLARRDGAGEGEAGERIPAARVQLRYAVQVEGGYGLALARAPAAKTTMVPVWVIVEVPPGQAPGVYCGEMTVEAGSRRFSVPVEVTVGSWTLPQPRDYVSHVSVLHSPDTLASWYEVEPYSDEHFSLIEKSLSMMGALGNDVIYVPVVKYTHLGNNSGMIRWVESEDGFRPDFSVLERFLELYASHVGEPKVLCLEVWNRRIQRGESPIVTGLNPQTGEVFEMSAPKYGSAESDAFWRPMADGVKRIVQRHGWDEQCIMVGVATDWWPRRRTVDFLKAVMPHARWAIFTHGRDKDLRRSDRPGSVTIGPGMEIGYLESPFFLRGKGMWMPWERGFYKATSMRQYVTMVSHPLTYRLAPDVACTPECMGIARIGFDYWERGGYTLIGAHERWNKLYRRNPRALTLPGPDGPLPTVQYQMFREGVQEAEARIFVARVLYEDADTPMLDPELRARCQDAIRERLVFRELVDHHVEWASVLWRQRTEQIFRVAGTLHRHIEGGGK